MKALSVSLMATLAVLCLSGCASTHDRRESARAAAPPVTSEQAYISKVERLARRRGLEVIWINPPRTHRDELVMPRLP